MYNLKMNNITITGFTKTSQNPFKTFNINNKTYFTGLTANGIGNYYYNDPSLNPYLYIFQRVGDANEAKGSITLDISCVAYSYLVGGGGGGGGSYNASNQNTAGGQGGFHTSFMKRVAKNTELNITIGCGGVGGNNNSANNINGGNGGITSLNTKTAQASVPGGLCSSTLAGPGNKFTDIFGNIYFYGGGGGYSNISASKGGFGYNSTGGNSNPGNCGGGGGGYNCNGFDGSVTDRGVGGMPLGSQICVLCGGVGGGKGIYSGNGGNGYASGGGGGACNNIGTINNGGNGGAGGGGGAGSLAFTSAGGGSGGVGGIGGGGGGGGGYSIGSNYAGGKGGAGGVGLVVIIIIPFDVPCFKEGSKILTDKGYIPIENLRKFVMIQTFKHGFVPIYMI